MGGNPFYKGSDWLSVIKKGLQSLHYEFVISNPILYRKSNAILYQKSNRLQVIDFLNCCLRKNIPWKSGPQTIEVPAHLLCARWKSANDRHPKTPFCGITWHNTPKPPHQQHHSWFRWNISTLHMCGFRSRDCSDKRRIINWSPKLSGWVTLLILQTSLFGLERYLGTVHRGSATTLLPLTKTGLRDPVKIEWWQCQL